MFDRHKPEANAMWKRNLCPLSWPFAGHQCPHCKFLCWINAIYTQSKHCRLFHRYELTRKLSQKRKALRLWYPDLVACHFGEQDVYVWYGHPRADSVLPSLCVVRQLSFPLLFFLWFDDAKPMQIELGNCSLMQLQLPFALPLSSNRTDLVS